MLKIHRPALRLGLSPKALEMASFNWRGRLLRREQVAVAGPLPGWQGVLAALRQQLHSGAWSAGRAEVILSSHFVRHCLLPGQIRLAGSAEQSGYVRHLFRGEYGPAVDSWHVAVDSAGRGARLACAIDADLLDELGRICREAKLKLASVRPHLAAAANDVRLRIRQPRAWLAVLESDVCTLALLQSGQWQHVACARADTASAASLVSALRRQAALLPQATEGNLVYVCGAASDLAGSNQTADWRIDVLTRASGPGPAHLLPV